MFSTKNVDLFHPWAHFFFPETRNCIQNWDYFFFCFFYRLEINLADQAEVRMTHRDKKERVEKIEKKIISREHSRQKASAAGGPIFSRPNQKEMTMDFLNLSLIYIMLFSRFKE